MSDSGEPEQKLSRRDFLKLGGLGLGYLAVRPYYEILNGIYKRGPNDEFENNIESGISFIKNEYGVDIFTGIPKATNFFSPAYGKITGTDLSRYELSRGLGLVLEEIVKYPRNYFKKNLVGNIRFINNVKIGELDYYGGFGANLGTLGIAYSAENNEEGREYFRGVFHHELYHGTDFYDGLYFMDNKEWEDIHNCGCKVYWDVGGRDSKDGVTPPTSPLEWFLDPYGQMNAPEDRAVFAQVMMIPSLHRLLIDHITNTTDPNTREILEKKRNLIKNDFTRWSGGQMDDNYWNDLVNDKVNFDYFA